MILRYTGIFLALAISLVGCGGGGGGGSTSSTLPTPTVTQYPLKTAIVNTINDTQTKTITLTGKIIGIAIGGNGIMTQSPLASESFEKLPSLVKYSSLSYILFPDDPSSASTVIYKEYYDSNYAKLGRATEGNYEVVTSVKVVPSTAIIGDTGLLYTGNSYDTSAKKTLVSTISTSYKLESNGTNGALLRIISTSTFPTNSTITTDSYDISATGSVNYVSKQISNIASNTDMFFAFK